MPAIHFKFFKLMYGPDFVLWPPLYNFWPVWQVHIHPALPTFSWPLKKDQLRAAPPVSAFLLLKRDWLMTGANQNSEARRGGSS